MQRDCDDDHISNAYWPRSESRVSKTLADTQQIFNKILLEPRQDQNYTKALSQLAADIADIHVMAVHLSYEKSALQGMTKPLQEMLNQITMLVSIGGNV